MILKINDRGTLVERLQEKLGLEVDGTFGISTQDAVKKFQIENKLIADGIAGISTLGLLDLNFASYIKNGNNKDISWELPIKGVGFVAYNREPRGDQFGTKDTIDRCIAIAKEWYLAHPEVSIQFGDISLL